MTRKRKFIQIIKKLPVLRSVFRSMLRLKIFAGRIGEFTGEGIRWLWKSRETTNITGDLTQNSEQFLASAVGLVIGAPIDRVIAAFVELKNDKALQEHYLKQLSSHRDKFITDPKPRFGRRLAWYALVRIIKPRVVIETGVDKGLGSLVITAALRRNAEEGYIGKHFGTDINPDSGFLLSGDYASHGRVLLGDSITSLTNFTDDVDLFISDSDHDARYERKEYDTITQKLAKNAILVSDQGTRALMDYSKSTGRKFLFFHDQTTSAWMPSSGIGFSWKSSKGY